MYPKTYLLSVPSGSRSISDHRTSRLPLHVDLRQTLPVIYDWPPFERELVLLRKVFVGRASEPARRMCPAALSQVRFAALSLFPFSHLHNHLPQSSHHRALYRLYLPCLHGDPLSHRARLCGLHAHRAYHRAHPSAPAASPAAPLQPPRSRPALEGI